MSLTNPLWVRLRTLLTVVGVLLTLGALAAWGGTARPGPLFWAGVAVLSLMGLAAAGVAWWLFASPLPAHVRAPAAGPPEPRLLTGMVVLIAGALFAIGGLWDESWHFVYGSFGDDFLWPPHLMIYASMAVIALCALGVLVWVSRQLGGRGDLRLAARAEPAIGLLGLAALFLVVAAPSDELWHRIYGVDITAWSLPHIQVVIGFVAVMLSGAILLLGGAPGAWRGLGGLRFNELLALVAVAWAAHAGLQVGTAEWSGPDPIAGLLCVVGGPTAGDAFERAFWGRPEWLFPVVLAAIGVFFAQLAVQITRRAGAATIMALAVLLFRALTSLVVQAAEPRAPLFILPHALILAPALAVDLWYALRGARAAAGPGVLFGSALGGAAMLAAALPAIAALLPYPRVDATTAPLMILIGVPVALAAGAAGSGLGEWLALRAGPAEAPARPWVGWAAAGALALLGALAVAYMLSAPPPVA